MKQTKLKRTQVCLTEYEHKVLTERAQRTGLSLAEVIRRILDKDIEREERTRSNENKSERTNVTQHEATQANL